MMPVANAKFTARKIFKRLISPAQARMGTAEGVVAVWLALLNQVVIYSLLANRVKTLPKR